MLSIRDILFILALMMLIYFGAYLLSEVAIEGSFSTWAYKWLSS